MLAGRASDARTVRGDVATDRDAAASRELTTGQGAETESLRMKEEEGAVSEKSTRNALD